MAKDPAFLFYSQDFLVGTMAMPFEDRGRYITLLCYMHQNGPISEETIRLLVGSFSDILRLKFLQNESGLFYNNRLSIEVEKRAKFTDSRAINGKKGGRPIKNKVKVVNNWQDMLDFFDNSCICCGVKFELPNRPTKDHIIAQANGGIDDISNLQPLCRECNSSKCADHETDYRLKYLKQIPDKFKEIWFVNLKPKNKLQITDRLLKQKPKQNLIEDENVNVNEIDNELNNDVFISKPNLKIAFDGFVKMRKEIKKPLTGNAIQLIKNKVWKLADHNEDVAIEILNNSTMGCWQGVFALRPEIKANNQVEKESKFSKAVKGTDTYIQQKYATANKQ